MDEYCSYWNHPSDGRLYAVQLVGGEVVGAVKVPVTAPRRKHACEYVSKMTDGCAQWIREEIDTFQPLRER